MKIKVFALAVAAMALTVACNNKPAEVEDTLVEDTTVIEEIVDEEVADSTTVAVAETPAAKPAKPAVAKKEEKKAEPTVNYNNDGTKTVTSERRTRTEAKTAEPEVKYNEDGTKTVKSERRTRR